MNNLQKKGKAIFEILGSKVTGSAMLGIDGGLNFEVRQRLGMKNAKIFGKKFERLDLMIMRKKVNGGFKSLKGEQWWVIGR